LDAAILKASWPSQVIFSSTDHLLNHRRALYPSQFRDVFSAGKVSTVLSAPVEVRTAAVRSPDYLVPCSWSTMPRK
jgi:hypothetical protein